MLDCEGRVIERYDAPHTGRGLEALVDRLRKSCHRPQQEVGIAIELSWGAVVETLTEAGFSVFSINPKQVDRFREHVLFPLPRIILLDQQVRDVERRIARLLKELPENADDNPRKYRDIDLLLSLPGLGPTIASTILAEASRPIRDRDRHALR